MKAFFLASAAVLSAATVPASASVITIGGSLAEACYHNAEARRALPEAIRECDRAFAEQALTFQDEFATHVNRGILHMIRRDFDNARADFDKAAAMQPNHPEPWLNMGIMRFNGGDSAGALALFTKALELGTSAPEVAYYGRALANEDRGNIRAAYADLKRALALKPDWVEPARELARYQVRSR